MQATPPPLAQALRRHVKNGQIENRAPKLKCQLCRCTCRCNSTAVMLVPHLDREDVLQGSNGRDRLTLGKQHLTPPLPHIKHLALGPSKTMADTVSRNAQRRKAEADRAARAARDRGAAGGRREGGGEGPSDGHPLRGRLPKGWNFDDAREAAFTEKRLNSQVCERMCLML